MSYNLVSTLAPSFFNQIFFILASKDDNHNTSEEYKIRHDSTKELAALERLKNFHRLILGNILLAL